MSALIGLLGLGFIFASLIGIIKPSFIKQSTRKRVLVIVFFPGIIFFAVGVYLTPPSIEPKYSPNQSASNLKVEKLSAEKPVNNSLKRGKFDVDKIANQGKSIVNEYLGNPENCETFESSEFCKYDWLGTEIYFDKATKTPRTINISKLPSTKFSVKALKSIGLKIKSKPTFSNDSVIKWDYVNGKEISILSDKNSFGKVSNIQIRSVPFTISHTMASGLPVSAVIFFSLKHLHKELDDKNYSGSAVFKLYMDELIDKYGNDMQAKLIHSYQLSASDVLEIRRYKDSAMFSLDDNEFTVRFTKEILNNSLARKFWFNAE